MPARRPPDPLGGRWGRLGERVRRRPRPVWLGGTAALLVLALGLTQLDLGLAEGEQFVGEVDAVEGAEVLARAGFAGGGGGRCRSWYRTPAGPARPPMPSAASTGSPASATPSAASPAPGSTSACPSILTALTPSRSSRRCGGRRARPTPAPWSGSLAEDYDTREAAERDNLVVMPAALAVVLLILFVLLRAVVLPLLLIATVIVSFAAAFGVGVLSSDLVFGFAGIETTLPLIAFVFLVALGVDYNIFLVARAREEASEHGTADGMHRALASTGGVITGAGVVLAGTFSILALIPFVALVELGVIIAFGVLLDTLFVRSVIVPAMVWDIGSRVWWPGSPRR